MATKPKKSVYRNEWGDEASLLNPKTGKKQNKEAAIVNYLDYKNQGMDNFDIYNQLRAERTRRGHALDTSTMVSFEDIKLKREAYAKGDSLTGAVAAGWGEMTRDQKFGAPGQSMIMQEAIRRRIQGGKDGTRTGINEVATDMMGNVYDRPEQNRMHALLAPYLKHLQKASGLGMGDSTNPQNLTRPRKMASELSSLVPKNKKENEKAALIG